MNIFYAQVKKAIVVLSAVALIAGWVRVAGEPAAEESPDANMPAFEPSGRIRAIYQPDIGYRGMSRGEIPNPNNITGLFYKNGAYYLKRAKVSFVEGENECTGDSTLSLKTEPGAVFLFSNFTGYNKNKIKAVNLDSIREESNNSLGMRPGEKIAFGFGGKQYELEAFGELDRHDNPKNYSLVFSEKGAGGKQTIVRIPYMDDSALRLLFIGDLDGDGKPDIILDAQSHYENRHIMAFLSSTAKKGEFLRREAEKFDWFDC